MPRYGTITPPDTTPVDEGDAAFYGVDQDTNPELLSAGIASDARNKRSEKGSAKTRPGILTPTPFNQITSTIYGSGRFSDPNGREWLLRAHASSVQLVRWDSAAYDVTLPAGETISTDTEFEQALDRVIMFRGDDYVPLVWNPASGYAFEYLDAPSPTKANIPNAEDAEILKNSVWVPFNHDSIAKSDVLAYHQYDPVNNLYRINAGDDDFITRIFPYQENSLIVFKNQSAHLMSNIVPHPTTGLYKDSIIIDPINPEIGCVARKTPTMIGTSIRFLGQNGIYEISRNEESRLRINQEPISDPLIKVIERINWQHAHKAIAIAHRQYWYVAVPVYPSEEPNVVMVHNVRSNLWEAYDEFPDGVQFNNFIITDWIGEKRVFAVNNATGTVYLMYIGNEDRIYDTVYDIRDRFVSRAYLLRDNELKAQRRVRVALRTIHPKLTVKINEDGVNEVYTLVDGKERDRTRYDVWGAAKHDATNQNDDHAKPRRQDYSAALDVWLKSGIEAPLSQSKIYSYTTKSNSRYASVTVENEQGTCEVSSIGIEGFPTKHNLRIKG